MCSSVFPKIILVLIFWISSIETVWASSPDPSGERRCDTGEAAGPLYSEPTYWVYQNGSGYEINVPSDGSDCVGNVVIANGVPELELMHFMEQQI
jgi:hypothetical protein